MFDQGTTSKRPSNGLHSVDGDSEPIVARARDSDDPTPTSAANMEPPSLPAPFKNTSENEMSGQGSVRAFKQTENESNGVLKHFESNPESLSESSRPSEIDTALPREDATRNPPQQQLQDARHQWDQARFDTGTHSVFPSPSPSPTRPHSPGAFRVRPGGMSHRAASSDSTANITGIIDPGRDSDTPMVEASLVVEEDQVRNPEPLSPLVEATPIRRRRQIVAVAIAVLLLVAIIVGVVTGLLLNPRTPPPTPPPTIPPTSEPGGLFLQSLPPYTRASLLNETSPQSRAFNWVTTNDTIPWRDEPNATTRRLLRMLQRFVLATLYFSTGGETLWLERDNWLNRTSSECEWRGCCCGTGCKQFQFDMSLDDFFGNESDSTVLTGVFLSDNNLVGTLPREMWLLRNLQRFDMNRNTIQASIPSQIAELRALVTIRLADVVLTSTLPTHLGLMTNLLDLTIGRTDQTTAMTGTIPTELASLTALTALRLYGINLNTTPPSELWTLKNLESLHLHANKLTSTLPSDLGKLTNLKSLKLDNNFLRDLFLPSWAI
jgi:hypothetical protein